MLGLLQPAFAAGLTWTSCSQTLRCREETEAAKGGGEAEAAEECDLASAGKWFLLSSYNPSCPSPTCLCWQGDAEEVLEV